MSTQQQISSGYIISWYVSKLRSLNVAVSASFQWLGGWFSDSAGGCKELCCKFCSSLTSSVANVVHAVLKESRILSIPICHLCSQVFGALASWPYPPVLRCKSSKMQQVCYQAGPCPSRLLLLCFLPNPARWWFQPIPENISPGIQPK